MILPYKPRENHNSLTDALFVSPGTGQPVCKLYSPSSTRKFLLDKIHIILCPLHKTAAAAAKSLQSCPTQCDPIDGAHQAPPSLGFSRQEHWSGLPFPSPMHESEK